MIAWYDPTSAGKDYPPDARLSLSQFSGAGAGAFRVNVHTTPGLELFDYPLNTRLENTFPAGQGEAFGVLHYPGKDRTPVEILSFRRVIGHEFVVPEPSGEKQKRSDECVIQHRNMIADEEKGEFSPIQMFLAENPGTAEELHENIKGYANR